MKIKSKMHPSRIRSKITGILLSAALLASAVTGLQIPSLPSLNAAPTLTVSAASSSPLPDNIADGVILHAWNWSFRAIKDNMQAIAEAGYTSVQTSPVQRPKDYFNASTSQWDWWKVYQPTSLCFSPGGHPWFGSKEDFKAMCEEADKYGIKIIVDIVANHMANNTGGMGNVRADISDQNEATYRDDDSCWHLNGSRGINYGQQNRYGGTDSLTYGFGGWPDLNTGNKKIQNAIISLLKECYDLGADGFRFDAAKHIELPTDPGGASDFWPTVINGIESYANSKGHPVYCYGEILDDSATDIKNYTKYIAVTDNRAGNATRYGVRDGDIGKAANSSLTYNGIPYQKIVLWSESHDTYANDGYSGESTRFNQDQINRAWAIIAARQFPALYFVRPDNPRSQMMGQMSGNTAWKNKEVAEVNKFHNAFVGESEYMSGSGGTVLVERGTTGAVLVNIGGNGGQISAKVNKMKDGTYKDQVSGSTFTVSGGYISGSIGSKGIAVVYNAGKVPSFGSVSASPAGTAFTDSITVTLSVNNVSNAKYTTSEGASGSFTNGQKITLGASSAIGASITLNLSGTKSDGTQASASYTYTKKDPSAVTTIYFDNNAYQWSKVYAYIYNKTGTDPIPDPIPPTPSSNILFTNSLNWWNVKAYFFNSSGTVGEPWPGSSMTAVGDNGYGSTNFSIAIPNGATMVIFNDNGGTQTKDLPLAGVAGYWLDGSADNAKSWSNAAALQSSDTAPAASDNTPCNAPWPGQEMKQDAASGYYSLVVPDAFQNGLVIFSDGKENTKSRYPADLEEGLSIGGSSKLFAANHSWKDYAPPVPSKLSVSLNVSASTIRLGQTVTLTASASGASGAVTYSYQANSTSVSGSGSTVSWTPTAAGTYTVTVTAKDSGGTACASKIVTVEKKEDPVPTLVNNASLSASSVTLGKSVTISGTASGGKAPYQYAFYVKKTSSDSYSTLQDFSSDTNAVYTPAAAASYQIKVKVKDSLGTVKEKLMTLEVTKPVTALTNLSSLSAETIPLGSHLTVNCKASGGTAPYQYAVSYKKSSSASYSTVQAYSTNKVVTFKPAAATVYQVMVKVKDAKDAVKSLTFDLTVTGTPVSKLNNTSKVSAASVALGKSITMTASATGGTSPYRYGFSYRKGTSGNFTLLKNYSTAKTYTFTPKSSGIYTLCMKVKDAKNQVVLKKITVKVTLAALTNTSTLSASSVKLGKSITVDCKASGGKSPYQYAVAVKKASSENYVSVTGYTKTTAVTYKPAAATEYIVRVKVKDASGNISSKLLNFTVKK